jgi:hypothetical protein
MALQPVPAVETMPPARIIDTPDLHLGVRPMILVSPQEVVNGISVQMTTRFL